MGGSIQELLASRPADKNSNDSARESSEYTAFSHGRVGRQPQMMITFRFASGRIEAFAYSMLSHIESDDPNTSFRLDFGKQATTVTGTNLATLLRYVTEHRCVEIIESERTELLADSNDEIRVSSIARVAAT